MAKPLFMYAMELVKHEKLLASDRLVFGYLACRQGTHPECWPGERTIATDLGLSKQTVRDATARLCKKGLIDKTPGGPGRGHPHHYAVHLEKRSSHQTISGNRKGPAARPLKSNKRSREHTEMVQPLDQKQSVSSKRTSARARKTFIPPTAEQVKAYAESQGNPIFNAEKFVKHYTDRSWHDINGKPVRSWKGKVRYWLQGDNEKRIEQGLPPLDGYSQYGTHEATYEEALAALGEST